MIERTDQEKQKLKDKIITDLYNSNEIQRKCNGICARNFIHKDTFIAEDIVQETFLHLSKKSADFIIELYEDNPKRLIGLCVTIACLKGVVQNRGYPKHSLAPWILFASNFQQLSHLNPTETHSSDDTNQDKHQIVLSDSSTEPDNYAEMWELIRTELTEEEKVTLEYFLNLKKKAGRLKTHLKQQYNFLLQRIEEILQNHKIRTI